VLQNIGLTYCIENKTAVQRQTDDNLNDNTYMSRGIFFYHSLLNLVTV